uniref:3-oxoacyl-[acyl-carrier-protein] synthase III C-terminal domain-containing protein n=1 Tax=Paenibacillus koleovorans TaxID=121608 RepID=UPI000FD8D5BE
MAAQVDWFIPHSANLRMIEPICEKLGFPLERTLYSLEYFGNTSAATIPLAMDMAVRDKRVKEGDRLLLYGFGAGLVQAGMLLEW